MQRTGKPTINDVARIAGVSKKTVSRVINRSPLLNPETRVRVERVIAELGYVPNVQARALALRHNFLIALIHDNPNAQMVMNVQGGMLDAMRGTEFELLVRPVDRNSTAMLADVRAFLERQRPFGVLLLPPVSENDALAKLCSELGIRYVRMGAAMLDVPERMVASNDRDVVVEAVGHLIALGHRRIGFIQGPSGFLSARERREGFAAALAAAGFALDEALIAEGNYTFETGLIAAQKLLGQADRPTAIFASNDEMAAAALHIARDRGLDVPADLSIIGFDDTATARHIWPPMTTIHWPIEPMVQSAAHKLLAEYLEPAADQGGDPIFRASLIHRASVAPPSRR